MCRVSIVIPIYNSEKYIRECIEMVLCQTYKNFELLLIDDGSTDDSGDICKEYEKRDSRIKYYYKENSGVADTRNFGINCATAPYIMFIDSDDYIFSNTIENLILGIQNSEFSMCGYEIFDDTNNKLLHSYKCPGFEGDIAGFANRISSYISPPFLLGPCFKMFRTHIIRNNNIMFPIELSYGEDAIFVLNYLMFVHSVCCCDYVGYRYRRHGNKSLSTSFRKDKIDINMQINELILRLLSKFGVENRESFLGQRNIEVFVSFIREMMKSKVPYHEKKRLFYKKAEEYSILNTSVSRNSQRLVKFVAKYKIMFFLLYVFNIKQ